MPLTYEEAVEEARAIVSDRSAPERQRRAMEVLMRYAERGRRQTTSTADATTSFSRVGQILGEAQRELDRGMARLTPPPLPRVSVESDEEGVE